LGHFAPETCGSGQVELEESGSGIDRFLTAWLQMKTYYKPTQWRGKRAVYTSIDPAEPKRRALQMRIGIATLVLAFLGYAVIVWLIR
jgi:hypothetical protein